MCTDAGPLFRFFVMAVKARHRRFSFVLSVFWLSLSLLLFLFFFKFRNLLAKTNPQSKSFKATQSKHCPQPTQTKPQQREEDRVVNANTLLIHQTNPIQYSFTAHYIALQFAPIRKTIMSASRFITPLGIITLLHSAYSCLHYRSIIASSNLDLDVLVLDNPLFSASSPPNDVVIECFIGFFLCLIGQIVSAGEFVPVMSAKREIKAPLHISRDFDLWSTRASVIASVKNQ